MQEFLTVEIAFLDLLTSETLAFDIKLKNADVFFITYGYYCCLSDLSEEINDPLICV